MVKNHAGKVDNMQEFLQRDGAYKKAKEGCYKHKAGLRGADSQLRKEPKKLKTDQ
jgi:hypothetical protein